MPRVGTLDIDSLLANSTAFQTIASFGVEEFAQAVQNDLTVHDANLRDALGEIALVTTERLWASSGTDSMEMFEADEYSRVPTQRITAGYNFGAPLRKRAIAVGWTHEYFRRKTVSEFAAQLSAARRAHVAMLYRDLRRSIYLSANYTFAERLADPLINIPVKRLYNADSLPVPTGPNGETFDGATHTHYLANATLTGAVATSLVNTVLEHRVTGGIRVVVAQADRSAWEGLTGFFKPYPDPRVQYLATDVNRQTISIDRMNNLAIGTLGAAEVWVKPWGIANYPLAYDVAGPKPLVFRTRENDLMLETAAENDAFPLHAQFLESHYGFAVRNRGAAAILYVGGGSYVDPTIS
ncbi:MAG: hypothetical protein H0U67_16780 [Gemmatimonadetes bacterium]|nr:hypothetical protein [Gemmatimonadota bacterium]